MFDEWTIDRQAIGSFMVEQLRQSLKADRDAGLDDAEIDRIVEQYRRSDALSKAVDAEVQRLEAHLTGRIH